jgi:hypothetical protein
MYATHHTPHSHALLFHGRLHAVPEGSTIVENRCDHDLLYMPGPVAWFSHMVFDTLCGGGPCSNTEHMPIYSLV